MKKITKLITVILFITISALVVGCTNGSYNSVIQLDEVELNFENNTLFWNKVEHADYYELYINNVFFDRTEELYYSFKEKYGKYAVNVIACSDDVNYRDSKYSTIEFEVLSNDGTINFFMINDTHGAFDDNEYSGMSRISSLLKNLDLNNDFIKIANGDVFQGSYISNSFYGLPLVEALNELDFDAFVLGNHEFDWGIQEIEKYKDGDLTNGEAEFPFLGANIIKKSTGELLEWVEPYLIVERSNFKVGVIGVIGEAQESSILRENIEDYEFIEVIPVVKKYASYLRNTENCDVVIVSIHDYDDALNQEIAELSGDWRIDSILCGHTHTNNYEEYLRTDGKTIIGVQNQDKNRSASIVTLEIKNNEYNKSAFKRVYPADYPIDEEFQFVIDKYSEYLNNGDLVLGITNNYLSKDILGSFSTDAMLDYFSTDVAIINTAGIRSTIPSGEITVSDVFNAFPFNNEVYLVELKGSELISLYYNNQNFLYFNEEFDLNNINTSSYYEIAVIDYVFTGVYYDEFDNKEYVDTDVLLRDLLIEYIDNLY